VAPVVLADGAHAIDVDNRRTYDAAALLLERRSALDQMIEDVVEERSGQLA